MASFWARRVGLPLLLARFPAARMTLGVENRLNKTAWPYSRASYARDLQWCLASAVGMFMRACLPCANTTLPGGFRLPPPKNKRDIPAHSGGSMPTCMWYLIQQTAPSLVVTARTSLYTNVSISLYPSSNIGLDLPFSYRKIILPNKSTHPLHETGTLGFPFYSLYYFTYLPVGFFGGGVTFQTLPFICHGHCLHAAFLPLHFPLYTPPTHTHYTICTHT